MKQLATLLAGLITTAGTFAQLRYDDGPIINNSSFVVQGTWGRNNISFSFQNGTADIAGNDEQNAIRQAFQIWADYANLNFTEVASGGDILISWATGDHGDGNPFDGPFGVLAHSYYPPPNGSFAGDMHFDDDEQWTMDERPPFSGQPVDLVTVAAHEIGHALGLNHSNVACALMNADYNGSHRYLAQDDIDGIRNIYGVFGNRTPIRTSGLSCTGGTFYMNNLPTGATVSWASNNTSIATVTNTANQGIVTRVNNASGNVRITGTINLPCGTTVSESMDIRIGVPPAASNGYIMLDESGTFPDGYSNFDLQRFSPAVISIYDPAGTGTYFWSLSNNLSLQSGRGTPEISILATGNVGSFLSIAVQPENACGRNSGITVTGHIASLGAQLYSISPNPASTTIAVNALGKRGNIKEIRITNKFGKVCKIIKTGQQNQTVNINISELPADVYYLQIFDGSKWTSKSMIKVR